MELKCRGLHRREGHVYSRQYRKSFTIPETSPTSGIFKGSIDLVDIQASSSFRSASTSADGDKIAIQNGATLTVNYDDLSGDGSDSNVDAGSTITTETSAPTAVITTPVNKSSTQIRRPVFTGAVSDVTSGLDVSTIYVYFDSADDKPNSVDVSAGLGSTTDRNSPSLPGGTADGDSSSSFTFTPSTDLPSPGVATPDHIVDWQVQMTDLAGNVGWSDVDSSSSNVSTSAGSGVGKEGRGQPHKVRIDRILPGVTEVYTGFGIDQTVTPAVRTVNNADWFEINFNDVMDASTIQTSDFEVVIGSTTHVPVEVVAGVTGFEDRIFARLATAQPGDWVGTFRMAGPISDAAGNTTSSGSKVMKDALGPGITVTMSAGSASSAPTSITKNTITITSDEALSADPTVEIFNEGVSSTPEGTVTAVAQGGNTWVAAFDVTSFDGGSSSNLAGKKKAVRVTASDAATLTQTGSVVGGDTTLPASATVGVRVYGATDTSSSGAVTFTLDKTPPALTLSPTGNITSGSPTVVWNFGESVTPTNVKFGPTGTYLVDVTSELSTSDNSAFSRATSGLALRGYSTTADATDLAGNFTGGMSGTFSVVARIPGAPTGVSATRGNTLASVSWTAPTDNGGAAISVYTVTSSPGGITGSSIGAAASADVNGLTNGTSYTFTVTATNSSGTGPSSSASGAVAPATAPGSPTSITVSGGAGFALVSWTAPTDNGGAAISGYKVTSDPGVLMASAGGSDTAAVVTGLTNLTTYTFTVTATNSAGTGAASAASSGFTPFDSASAPSFDHVTMNVNSANVQVDSSVNLTVFPVTGTGEALAEFEANWSLIFGSSLGTVNGSSTASGSSVVYGATGAGTVVVRASVTQAGTGVTKMVDTVVTNIAAPQEAIAPPPIAPSSPEPIVIPDTPSLDGDTQASAGVIQPTQGAMLVIAAPTSGDSDFAFTTGVTVDIPAGAAQAGVALGVKASLNSELEEADFEPLPEGFKTAPAQSFTIDLTNAQGEEVTGITLDTPMTVSLTVAPGDLEAVGIDAQSIVILKAEDPTVGPWIEFVTSFSLTADGLYKFNTSLSRFSTFRLGSRVRVTSVPDETPDAELPSAGDSFPTTLQTLITTTAGLVLIIAGGTYLVTQRRKLVSASA